MQDTIHRPRHHASASSRHASSLTSPSRAPSSVSPPPLSPLVVQLPPSTANGVLRALLVHLPGRVFVRHAADPDADDVNATAASSMTLALSGDSALLMRAIVADLVPWREGAIALNVSVNMSSLPPTFDVDGASLLVDIDWPLARSLAYVSSTAETVVDESALANATTAKVALVAVNNSLFASLATPLTIHSLSLESSDKGLVQLEAPAVTTSGTMHLTASCGDAVVAVAADHVAAKNVCATAMHAGSIYVASHDVAVRSMVSTMAGNGVISYYDYGTCGDHSITMLGSGDVYAGSLHCNDTSVYSIGTGHVVLDGGHSLTATHLGLGHLSYVRELPDVVAHIGFAPREGMHRVDKAFEKWSLVAVPPFAPKANDETGLSDVASLGAISGASTTWMMTDFEAMAALTVLVVVPMAMWTYVRRRHYSRVA
ncbi:Aste57867_19250 [Aphanomyces stellatus]|uniref:Aste57867_19250 protein n=1 Tax=Aphanomyces stellatus TaxID=120398 RepID=A0A485LCA3_9STRA|nr:hypothetical protein As57867_019186 [Aphanomyces stellatus]VFT95970.1 Aste57867_19250 [Aphanomyces stellatus]